MLSTRVMLWWPMQSAFLSGVVENSGGEYSIGENGPVETNDNPALAAVYLGKKQEVSWRWNSSEYFADLADELDLGGF